jgi:hypothetical protein
VVLVSCWRHWGGAWCGSPRRSALGAASHGCTLHGLLQVADISLEDYIAVKPKFAVYVPHTAGRYQKRRFRKALCPIVERCAAIRAGEGRQRPAGAC